MASATGSNDRPILLTGVAGFIGFHVARRLLDGGRAVVGIDNLSPYYDVTLKEARLRQLEGLQGFRFDRIDLADRDGMTRLFDDAQPGDVIHLAAQAGVRHSLTHPHSYIDANLVGFTNVLEGCRHGDVHHLVFASSSSVYGANTNMPFSVHRGVDHPLSLYAATKRANELMAHTYAHLYRLPCTGLRFFTVYGPWGRPDMAMFKFAKAILSGEPIDVYNNGRMRRAFTYIDDIVEGVIRLLDHRPEPDAGWSADQPDPATSSAPFRLYNIGNDRPEDLMHVIGLLEQALGRPADKRMLPMQPGDVPATHADIGDLAAAVGFTPATPIETGVNRFVAWYRDYYRV